MEGDRISNSGSENGSLNKGIILNNNENSIEPLIKKIDELIVSVGDTNSNQKEVNQTMKASIQVIKNLTEVMKESIEEVKISNANNQEILKTILEMLREKKKEENI